MKCPKCGVECVDHSSIDSETEEIVVWGRECPACGWQRVEDGGWWDEDPDGRSR